MRIIRIIITILICLLLLPVNVFAVTYAKVGADGDFNGNINVPSGSKYYINGVAIAVGDITGAAASGANSDITSITGLTTPLAANYGGTGVANNAGETITMVGDDAITFTTSAATSVTLPTAGTLMANLIEDTTPELGGELDAGAHTIGFTIQSTTGDGTTTIDWKLGNHFKFTFGAQADTFTFTAPTNPGHLTLILIQDGTGGRDATWPAEVKWLGTEPTWTDGGISKGIVIGFIYDGTYYWGQGTPWEV